MFEIRVDGAPVDLSSCDELNSAIIKVSEGTV